MNFMFVTVVRLKCQGKLIMHVKGKLYSLNDYIRLNFEILGDCVSENYSF